MAQWKPAAGDWKIQGEFAVNSKTNQRLLINHDNVYGLRSGTKADTNAVILHYLNSNEIPDVNNMGWISPDKRHNVLADLDKFITANGLGASGANAEQSAKDAAFNEYYKDTYSLEEGTSGKALLTNLEGAYQREAESAATLADVNYQSQAIQQAQTVKAVADQVRAERMARLRAGMSESQIASQDMQALMANINTLNQNAQMLNQGRYQAQLGAASAKDQAYMAYLDQANARGQNAAAMYATDAGNISKQVNQYLINSYGSTDVDKKLYDDAWAKVSGTTTK